MTDHESGTPQSWDVRTTPPWARVPYLCFLALVTLYLVSCFHFALRERPPKWVWFGYWQMFSLYDRGSADLEAEMLVEGSWKPLDLPEVFPTRWESGYRYSRSSFRRSKGRVRVLAASACQRVRRACPLAGRASLARRSGVLVLARRA